MEAAEAEEITSFAKRARPSARAIDYDHHDPGSDSEVAEKLSTTRAELLKAAETSDVTALATKFTAIQLLANLAIAEVSLLTISSLVWLRLRAYNAYLLVELPNPLTTHLEAQVLCTTIGTHTFSSCYLSCDLV